MLGLRIQQALIRGLYEEVSLSTEVNDSSCPPKSLTLRFSDLLCKLGQKPKEKSRRRVESCNLGVRGCGQGSQPTEQTKISVLAEESPGPHPVHLGLVSLELLKPFQGPYPLRKEGEGAVVI